MPVTPSSSLSAPIRPAANVKQLASLCKLLGDSSRLRLLRLLRRERLNVSELTGILDLSQSGVSRHLKLLAGAGLVSEHREGSWVYYQITTDPASQAGQMLDALREAMAHAPDEEGDLARLEQALRERREHASAPFCEREGIPIPGRSWRAWSRALLRLLPALHVADLGCGDGALALELARSASRVIAVDVAPRVLERARRRFAAAGVTNIELRQGELEALPLAAGEVELCLLSQALHHAASPAQALAEAYRVLCPDGRVLVLDLEPHGEEWVREKLGDQWLGFDRWRLHEMLTAAGFGEIDYETLPHRRGEPFQINLTSARRIRSNRRRQPCGAS
jgi:ArsR family transcriptional regulator